LDEIVGRGELLSARATPLGAEDGRAVRVDVTGLLAKSQQAVAEAAASSGRSPADVPRSSRQRRNDRPERGGGTLDDRLLADALRVIDGEANGGSADQGAAADHGAAGEHDLPHVRLRYRVTNRERSLGSRLAGELARRHGDVGLPDGCIEVEFDGVAGQSFGAFNLPGTTLTLTGETQDYVGKSMAGGVIAIRPRAGDDAVKGSVIAGNTLLYGATGGSLFAAGSVGERVCVRNSGASAVVEGCGDHGCEYMTGGVVVVIGKTGRNFAAGMSGGVAYVLDESGSFERRLNTAMVAATRLAPATGASAGGAGGTGGGRADAADDGRVLHALLERHVELTGSQRAAALLADWRATKAKFWRVAPVAGELPVSDLPVGDLSIGDLAVGNQRAVEGGDVDAVVER
ncbi:MAG TPA: hypothetical protein VFD39_14875, partial [Trueperaceae bacterium]|nr:hypothetical protein [Trueperaceae bacterium]